MRKTVFLFIVLLSGIFNSFGQIEGVSAPKNYNISKEEDKFTADLPPILSITNIEFSKNSLKATESAELKITIKNTGYGDARDVYVNLSGGVSGLSFPSKINVPLITKEGGMQTVSANFTAGMDVVNTDVYINIEVIEPNFKVKIKGKQLQFALMEFLKPKLEIPKYAAKESMSSDPNMKIDQNEMIDVQFYIQNTGQGSAENITVRVDNNQTGVQASGVRNKANPKNIEKKEPSFTEINSGDYELVTYCYFINSDFNDKELVFNVNIGEKMGKFGANSTIKIPVDIELNPQGQGEIKKVDKIEPEKQGKVIVKDLPDLEADVDRYIPVNKIKNQNAVALIIAVTNYNKTYNVKYAARDAQILRQYLIKTFGYQEENILPQKADEAMTYGTMKTYIKNTLSNYLKKDGSSDLFVYYVGHGAKSFFGKDKDKVFLIPQDADPKYASSDNAYLIDEFIADINKLNARKKYIVIESCYSGQTGDGKFIIDNVSGEAEIELNITAPDNTFIFQSSEAKQVSNWYEDKQHSMFTYFFLKAIMDLNKDKKDGNITVGQIETYINDENNGMPYWSKRACNGRLQNAIITGKKDFIFLNFNKDN